MSHDSLIPKKIVKTKLPKMTVHINFKRFLKQSYNLTSFQHFKNGFHKSSLTCWLGSLWLIFNDNKFVKTKLLVPAIASLIKKLWMQIPKIRLTRLNPNNSFCTFRRSAVCWLPLPIINLSILAFFSSMMTKLNLTLLVFNRRSKLG